MLNLYAASTTVMMLLEAFTACIGIPVVQIFWPVSQQGTMVFNNINS